MDLCPVRCLDMSRPSGEGEIGKAEVRLSPIPVVWADRPWMMLMPIQVAQCVGCQVCVQECPTNAITIESKVKEVAFSRRGPISHLPPEQGWVPLDAFTRATPEEPGETPWADGRPWHVAERQSTWQSWRSWLGERAEDLRAPCQAACPVGTNAGLYVSLIAQGHYDEALQVASEPNPFPSICGRVCTAPCEDVCRRGEFDSPIAIRDFDAIQELGVEFRLNSAIGLDYTLDELQAEYDAVLLAVGAQRSQRLNIPGESNFRDVIPATTFLKQFNLELNTHIEGDITVVGGGSTAMDAARSALRAGANSVTILYRRTKAEMPAQFEEVRAALKEGIHLYELTAPLAVLGTNGRLTGVRCQRMTLGEPDEKGRRRPVPLPDSEFDVATSKVIVAIGEAPDPSFLPEGTSVEVAPWGGLLVNKETLATGANGIFAAGDVTYGPKTIIHAAAHGRLAARSIHAYLRKLSPRAVHEMPEDEFETHSTLPPDSTLHLDLRPTEREEMPLRGEEASRDRSLEFATGFTEEQARREASRCLRCDLSYLCPTINVINPELLVKK